MRFASLGILQQRNRDKLTLEVFKRELVRRNILDAFCKDIYVPKESAPWL